VPYPNRDSRVCLALARLAARVVRVAPGRILISPVFMKERVLLVDDDRSVRESLRKVLEEENYEVSLARNAEEAWERLTREKTDLLLLDLGLPRRNGWDAFERITSANPFLPIIMITGQPHQYSMAMAAGVGALMEKPLDVAQLLQTMQDLLSEAAITRLRRLCGLGGEVRYVPCDSDRFLEGIQKRHAIPFGYRPAPGETEAEETWAPRLTARTTTAWSQPKTSGEQ
jgi:CheY-like chemotaxis protein